MTAEPPSADLDRLRAITDEVLRLTRHGRITYPGDRLDTSAFRILWQLVEHEVTTQRDLAEALQLEQSTISRQVGAAIRNGLVEQVTAPGSPTRRLRATDSGREAFAHDAALRAGPFGAAVADLGGPEADRLVALLRAFNDAVDHAHAAVTG